jgi:hypothetical protein
MILAAVILFGIAVVSMVMGNYYSAIGFLVAAVIMYIRAKSKKEG